MHRIYRLYIVDAYVDLSTTVVCDLEVASTRKKFMMNDGFTAEVACGNVWQTRWKVLWERVQLPVKAKFCGRHNTPWPLHSHPSTDRKERRTWSSLSVSEPSHKFGTNPPTIFLVIVVTGTHTQTDTQSNAGKNIAYSLAFAGRITARSHHDWQRFDKSINELVSGFSLHLLPIEMVQLGLAPTTGTGLEALPPPDPPSRHHCILYVHRTCFN